MKPNRFPRARRLTGQESFRRLFREGRSVREEWMRLRAVPNGRTVSRFGCSIRRQALPSAVSRNRLKRWLREAFRRNQARFPAGTDLVAVVLQHPGKGSFEKVQCRLLRLSDRLLEGGSFSRESGSTGRRLPPDSFRASD